MTKATFYHAGCPVCVEAEGMVAQAIDRSQYDLEVVHFSQTPNRIAEAGERWGQVSSSLGVG